MTVIDRHPDRLALAERIGAIAIDDRNGDHDQVLDFTEGAGADRGCEYMGYQCHDSAGREVPNTTMNDLVKSVRATGGLGVVGAFVPEDPGGDDELAKKGEIAFDFGAFWNKGLAMGTGQANVKAYNRQLCRLIQLDRAQPSFIVSHECSLEEAPEAYEHFDKRDVGWTKVVLKPGMSAGSKSTGKAGAVANTGAKGSKATKSHAHAHGTK